jgi:hypothetical protein
MHHVSTIEQGAHGWTIQMYQLWSMSVDSLYEIYVSLVKLTVIKYKKVQSLIKKLAIMYFIFTSVISFCFFYVFIKNSL